MAIGLNISINVKDIDKARLVAHQNGKTYLNMTAFVNNEKGQYGDNGFISHAQSKEERDTKSQTPILGNVTVFWDDSNTFQTQQQQQAPQATKQQTQYQSPAPAADGLDQDIPF